MSRMSHALDGNFTQSGLQSKSKSTTYSWQQHVMVGVLSMLILLSAFAVVYVKDLNRRLFIQYQQLQRVEQQATIEHGKLLLERSTLDSQARIQTLAQQRLGMVMPSSQQVIIVHD